MEQGIAGVAPAPEPGLGLFRWPAQQQGGQIGLQLPVQLQPIGLRQGGGGGRRSLAAQPLLPLAQALHPLLPLAAAVQGLQGPGVQHGRQSGQG